MKFDIQTKITDDQAKEIAVLANCYIGNAAGLRVLRGGVDPKFVTIKKGEDLPGGLPIAWVKIKDNLDVYSHVQHSAHGGMYCVVTHTFNQNKIQSILNKIFKKKG